VIHRDLQAARYPPVSLPASAFGVFAGSPGAPDALEGLPRRGRLDLLCLRPVHHVLEYEALFRLTAALRERGLDVGLHLRSALRDGAPFARLTVQRVTRLTEHGGRGALAAGLRRAVLGWRPGTAALALAAPLGFRGPGCGGDPDCAAAGESFLAALHRETPLWQIAAGAPPPLPRDAAGVRILIHQARFHIGDTLWLTPLLRALHTVFHRPRITLVGPPVAATVLAGNPHLEELLGYHPRDGEEGRRRVLAALAGRPFDAALFAFARRSESRWLAWATAAAGLPRRINLEYHDGFLDSRRPWEPVTHEGWFFWGTLPSPRLLMNALVPLVAGDLPEMEEDLEIHVDAAARRRADEVLEETGLAGRPFAVLTPGGLSSTRWPAASFARLAEALAGEMGLAVLVEGSAGEAPLLREIGSSAPVLVRQDPLDLLPALLARARLVVTNDSAPLHYAAALGVPGLYFAQREKLTHSHPSSPSCWALYDDQENDVARISVGQALGALRAMARRGVVELAGASE
jgi:ADP-heptose:LPS heptosyltransferase